MAATSVTDWELSTTVDGTEDAPVLVLVHSLGSSHIMWDGVADTLRDRVRLVLTELPGHGGSAPAPLTEPARMEDLVGALLRALDAQGITDFHLGGLSIGGMVALATAEIAPERVLTLSVMSTGPVNEPRGAWVDKAALVRREGTGVLVDATFERWFSPDFAIGRGRAEVDRIRQAFVSCSDEGYAQCCEVLSTTDLRPDLARLSMPVLLVSGQGDGALDWEKGDALAETIRSGEAPDVQIERIAGVRHMSAVESPAQVGAALARRMGISSRVWDPDDMPCDRTHVRMSAKPRKIDE